MRNAWFRLAAGWGALVLAGASARGQELLHEWKGGGPEGTGLGQTLRGAGDVDRDGHADVIAGYRLGSGNQAGTARVYSGRTGAVLFTFLGSNAGDQLGWAVDGAGDVNGDGYPDLIVGVRGDDGNGFDCGAARVYSGRDGSLLHVLRGESQRLRLGQAVAGVGDVDGDGRDDVAVGASPDVTSAHPAGFVRVYSGATGEILWQVSGATPVSRLGWAVRAAGDVNGDGVPDVVVGDRRDATRGTDAGAVLVLSGVDGATLAVFHGDRAGDQLGTDVDGAGDVDGDGRPDVVAGAPFHDGAFLNGGVVRVYSGATGAVLLERQGEGADDQLGTSVAGCGDVDGDGRPDVIAGAPMDDNAGANSGSAFVLSGADGSLLWRVDGNSGNDRLGQSVAGAGDLDGDGGLDWVVGAPLDAVGSVSFAGTVRAYRGLPPPASGPVRYCVASANSVGPGATLDWSGSTRLSAGGFGLHAHGLPESGKGMFLMGAQQAHTPFQQGILCVAPIVRIPPMQTAVGGALSRQIELAGGPGGMPSIAAGSTWCFQLSYLDPGSPAGAWNTSDALMVTFEP